MKYDCCHINQSIINERKKGMMMIDD